MHALTRGDVSFSSNGHRKDMDRVAIFNPEDDELIDNFNSHLTLEDHQQRTL